MDQRNRKNFFRNGRLMRQKIIYLWSMKIKMRRRKELLTDLLIKVIHMEMIGGLERWLKNLALSKPYGEWGDQRMVADPISLVNSWGGFQILILGVGTLSKAQLDKDICIKAGISRLYASKMIILLHWLGMWNAMPKKPDYA